MKRQRSRLFLLGVLALALSVAVAGVSGGAADAKKKKGKRKGAKTFLVTRTVPAAIPLGVLQGGVLRAGFIKVPIGTIGGKKLKGKLIGFSTVSVTTIFSGGPGFANSIFAQVFAPDQRNASLTNPTTNNGNAPSETLSGPTTETPNSVTLVCVPITVSGYTQPPCQDPDQTLGPPYAGTISNQNLQRFGGTPASGTWAVKVANFSTTIPATLNSIAVTGNLISKPK